MLKPLQLSLSAGILLLGTLSGCGADAGTHAGASTAPVTTGWVTPEEMIRGEEHAAFRARYDTVAVEERLVEMLGKLSPGAEVLVFYGSWCGDSRREVPRFLRIVEKGGVAKGQVRFYALDRTKKSADGLTERYGIERIPTFILLREGKELGRVVELPRSTLEGDLVEILVGALKK